ncbi:MAG: type I secretion system permease/ATPase [Roseitalea porphyridii]
MNVQQQSHVETDNQQVDSAVLSYNIINESAVKCLAIILQFYRFAADPDQILQELASDSETLRPRDIVRTAREMGLRAREVTINSSRLERQPFPAICIETDGRYSIIGKCEGGKVLRQVPGQSPQALEIGEFEKIWSGVLILLTRREAIAGGDRKFDITWFLPSVIKYRKIFSEIIVFSFFIQLFALVTPLFFQVVLDKVMVHRSLDTLYVLIIGMIFIIFFENIMGFLRSYVFSHTTSRIDVELGVRLYRHLLSLPLNYFESRPVGQTVARVKELENIRAFLTGSALSLCMDTAFASIFFVIMYHYSPLLFSVVVASIPFYLIISFLITPSLRERIEEKFQRGAENQAFLVESVYGVETLKALAVEPRMRRRFEEQLSGYVQASFNSVELNLIGSQAVQLVSKLTSAAILMFGAKLVIEGEMTIGAMIAFNLFAGQVSSPILRLAQMWQDFQQMRISVARLGDVLNCPTEPGYNPNRQSLPAISGKISFRSVDFRYGLDGKEVLRDVSFDIAPGEVIGIVGRSGSGKSTLTKLLQRLYVPSRGSIAVDGVDLALVDPTWLRRQIGVVLQDNVLFSRSIRDNITLADSTLSTSSVVESAKMAGAHEFILELPHGYDTKLEERATNLSGGQKQRIAIARALATQPRILVFDEATSALDYESERKIQENMEQICKGRTVIIVAHRLSAVRNADRILVLDQGRLVEQGAHDVLIAADGVYSHLFKQQAG